METSVLGKSRVVWSILKVQWNRTKRYSIDSRKQIVPTVNEMLKREMKGTPDVQNAREPNSQEASV